MNVVLAFDKFKGCATSQQLNEAARQALSDAFPSVKVDCVPVADGGDGTVEVLAATRQGQWLMMQAPGPLLQLPPVNARYYLCDDDTAFIEVAAASGLALVPDQARDVMRATTLGTGLLMRDAMEHGSRHIVLGLGGSATCDAGMGIMSALGAEFTDSNGHYLYPCGESLEKIRHIETRGIPQEVLDCRFTLLTDVDNPLCGKNGTASVYTDFYNISPEEVIGKGKTKDVANARQLSTYLIRKLTGQTLEQIGEVMNRDHTTVLHSIRKVEENLQNDPKLVDAVHDITANITNK